MTLSKFLVLLVSLLLALVVAGIFPAVGGGAGQMIAAIFLAVGFKATIEYFLAKRKKREAKHVEKRLG
jgi:hypothetical protein